MGRQAATTATTAEDKDFTNVNMREMPSNYSLATNLAWRLRKLIVQGHCYFESEDNAREMCETLRSGGPVFIKLGQWLSQRPDVIGVAFSNHLRTLQDATVPHGWIHTVSMIAHALRLDIRQDCLVPSVFIELNKKPLASGSIAQVHRGKMRRGTVRKLRKQLGIEEEEGSNDCRDDNEIIDIVVKVRHPNVVEQFREGLGALRVAFAIGRWANPSLFAILEFNELAEELMTQCDLRLEAVAMQRFRDNFAGNKYVNFPEPLVWTECVIIETFQRGTTLANLGKPGLDENSNVFANNEEIETCRTECMRLLQATYLQMVLHDGFLHGDCHGGNLLFNVRRRSDDEMRAEREAFARFTTCKQLPPPPQQPSSLSEFGRSGGGGRADEYREPCPFEVEISLLDFGIAVELDKVHRTQHLRIMVGMMANQPDEVIAAFRILMEHRNMLVPEQFPAFAVECKQIVNELHTMRKQQLNNMVSIGQQMILMLDLLFRHRLVICSEIGHVMIGYILIEQGRLAINNENLLECTLRWIMFEDAGENFPLMPYVGHLLSAFFTCEQLEPLGVLPPIVDPIKLRDEERRRAQSLQDGCRFNSLVDISCGGCVQSPPPPPPPLLLEDVVIGGHCVPSCAPPPLQTGRGRRRRVVAAAAAAATAAAAAQPTIINACVGARL